MKNLTEYNSFREIKRGVTKVQEGAQLFDDTWKVRTRVEIPTSLINAYVKKVQAETGEDPRKKWSEQEIAEEITKYVTTAFMTVENLPVSIVSNVEQTPQVQVQEEMPEETQVETQVQPEEEVGRQAEVQAQEAQGNAQEAEAQAQMAQGESELAQTQAQNAQEVAQEVPQAQTPAQEI